MKVKSNRSWAAAVTAAATLLLLATASFAVQLTIGSAGGEAGSTVSVGVTLNDEGDDVAGVQNQIILDADLSIDSFTASSTLSAGIDDATVEIPLDDASMFPEFGTVTIGEERIAYGYKDGNTLMATTGAEGDSGRGADVTTAAAHDAGATVESDLIPDCEGGSALVGTQGASFSLIDDTITALVLSLSSLDDKIANGQIYTCNIMISAEAEDGAKPLMCDGAASSTASGMELTTTCADGQVNVGVAACPGDCNPADGQVKINEVFQTISIFNGGDVAGCPAADFNPQDGQVKINEVFQVINVFNSACP